MQTLVTILAGAGIFIMIAVGLLLLMHFGPTLGQVRKKR